MGGVVTGILLTFVFAYVYNNLQNNIILFNEQECQEYEAYSFEILQVLPNMGALATVDSYTDDYYERCKNGGAVVFFPGENGEFYDDQKITVPKGEKVMQIGTFRYSTALGEKTVPIIEFWENN